jgi:hypothetical protein
MKERKRRGKQLMATLLKKGAEEGNGREKRAASNRRI